MSEFLSGLDKGDFNRWCAEGLLLFRVFTRLTWFHRQKWRNAAVEGSSCVRVISFMSAAYPAPLTSTLRVSNSVMFYGRLDIVRSEWLSAGNWCKSTKLSMTPVRRLCHCVHRSDLYALKSWTSLQMCPDFPSLWTLVRTPVLLFSPQSLFTAPGVNACIKS